MSHQFVQACRDLAQGAMLNCADKLGENVAAALHDLGQLVQRAPGLGAMTPLEFLQAIDLNLLFLPRSADHFNSGEILRGRAIAVQTDDRTDALVDLLLVSMGRGLDL